MNQAAATVSATVFSPGENGTAAPPKDEASGVRTSAPPLSAPSPVSHSWGWVTPSTA